MKYLSLLMWVTQFGLSVLFPLCFFLILAVWLRNQYALGMWIIVVLGILGLLVSFSSARSCLRAMQKEMERLDGKDDPPVSFNDHH